MEKLIETSKNILVSCLDAKAGEQVLVIADDTSRKIGEALREGAKALNCEAVLMIMQERQTSGQEPPGVVAEAMKAADIVLAPTAKSLTHTDARIKAAKAGARIATMPGITEEMFYSGAMTADYAQVEKLTARVTELLTNSSTAKIEKDGCVLKLDLQGRAGVPSPGVYKKPGQSGNLPSGEAYIAPLENGTDGEIVIDGSMVGLGKLEAPLHAVIKGGRLHSLSGPGSERLGVLFENEKNAIVGELGIGTNETALLCGIVLEDEKVYGTVHIAFGTNTSFGGVNKAGCHLDGIVLKPTLYLDDTLVIQNGQFMI